MSVCRNILPNLLQQIEQSVLSVISHNIFIAYYMESAIMDSPICFHELLDRRKNSTLARTGLSMLLFWEIDKITNNFK